MDTLLLFFFNAPTDFFRPEAVENLTTSCDLALDQVTVMWADSRNTEDANLTYYIAFSVTGRDVQIFSGSRTLNSTQLEFVISGNFVQEGANISITVQACNDFGLGAPTVATVEIPGGKGVLHCTCLC